MAPQQKHAGDKGAGLALADSLLAGCRYLLVYGQWGDRPGWLKQDIKLRYIREMFTQDLTLQNYRRQKDVLAVASFILRTSGVGF